MIVYLVENRTNGKRYVGKTVRSLKQRWKEHCSNAEHSHTEMVIYAAIRKYGPESFDVSVLEEHATSAAMDAAEIRLIAELGTHVSLDRGYNMTLGGDGLSGYKHTEKTKRKMSETRKGRKLSPEHAKAIADGQRGVPRPKVAEARLGAGNPMFGRRQSDEARVKISKGLEGRNNVPVVAMDKMGNVVATYVSMRKAAEAVGGQANKIYEVCVGSRMTHKKLCWKYAGG